MCTACVLLYGNVVGRTSMEECGESAPMTKSVTPAESRSAEEALGPSIAVVACGTHTCQRKEACAVLSKEARTPHSVLQPVSDSLPSFILKIKISEC